MNQKFSFLFAVFVGLLLTTVMLLLSCNRQWEAPPDFIPPNIKATITIAALKAGYVRSNIDSIATDDIVGGVVIANDSSGNFYKQIIIEDSTGGIAINIDDYNLYAAFPLGRKVYVKLKGLFMGEDAGLLYLGGLPDNGGSVTPIASRLRDQYLVKGETGVPVEPLPVSVADLKSNPDRYMYSLVQFQNVEVKAGDTAKTYAYATPLAKSDASIVVKSCASSDTIIIRTSGYSYFANVPVPNGNGTLTGVYAFYKSPYNGRITPQIVLRDTADVQFKQSRCDASIQTSTPVLTSVKAIRSLYKNGGVLLGAYQISGVVISDALNKNISPGSVVLQDGDRGISVYFGGTLPYKLGDSLVLDVTSDSLIDYRGSMEIKTRRGTVPPAAIAGGKLISPAVVTIQQLNTNLKDIEFTLVSIKNATASGATVYSGNQVLSDASGNITLFTSASATFANAALPSGSKDWVGYGSFYNSLPEFQIRNTGDVLDGGSTDSTTQVTGIGDLMITEYIEGSSDNKYIELYNASDTAIDLSQYAIKLYPNGSSSPANTTVLDTLTGFTTLSSKGILVLQNPQATLLLPAGLLSYPTSVCNFNGDDAITVEKKGVVIDVFGKVGTDPGSGWTIAGNASASVDHSVRRLSSVLKGNTDWTSSAASEWFVAGKDDVSNLGIR